MKKTLMTIAALLVAAGMVMVSCQKPAAPKDDNALVDDDTPGGDQPGGETPGGDQPGGEEPGDNTPASLKGSNYYPLIMDAETFEVIKNKVVADIRPDDVNKFLYIWSDGNCYAAATATGLNFYGVAGEYTALTVGNVGWSGAGFNLKSGMDNYDKIAGLNEKGFVFHIAYKGAAGVPHGCYVTWNNKIYPFVLGEGNYEVEGNNLSAAKPINNDGKFVANEWNEYEFSMDDSGIDFSTEGVADSNIFCFLSGGVAGTAINLDAAFFYKK